jgi:hypothetical protein
MSHGAVVLKLSVRSSEPNSDHHPSSRPCQVILLRLAACNPRYDHCKDVNSEQALAPKTGHLQRLEGAWDKLS